jgi:acetyl-CoA carboxylase biotin carboxyl carrier protein
MTQEISTDDLFQMHALRELLHVLTNTDITEFSLERDGAKLHIKRSGMTPVYEPVPPVLSASHLAPLGSSRTPHPPADPHTAAHTLDIPAGWFTIISPMVGTFYVASSPKDDPFVNEGDEIQAGDTVGIIEAMKIMNEVESDIAGRVVRMLIQNAQPVEYGQPLMLIEPLA